MSTAQPELTSRGPVADAITQRGAATGDSGATSDNSPLCQLPKRGTRDQPSLTVDLPPLHPGQAVIADHPARFKVVVAGRRWGKTLLGVSKCVEGALARAGAYWWVAPNYKLAATGWQALQDLAAQFPAALAPHVRESERTVMFRGGGLVEVRSADDPDSLRSRGLCGVVLDETAYAQQTAWTYSLRPALTDHRGWALFISSPAGRGNWFHGLWTRAHELPGWAAWQAPSWTNPYLDPTEIESARVELGAAIFAQEYGAEFIDHATLQPFRAEWLVDAETVPGPRDLWTVIGIDPAISKRDTACQTALVGAGIPLTGADRTSLYVLTARAGHWTPYETAEQILALCQYWRPRALRLEDVAWQRALKDIVEREAQTRRIPLPAITLVRPELDKLRRAMQTSPLVESGRVLFAPGLEALKRALVSVPQDETAWDLVDAFGLALGGLPKVAPPSTPLVSPTREGVRLARSYVTLGSAAGMPRPHVRWRGGSAVWASPSPRAPQRKSVAASYAMAVPR